VGLGSIGTSVTRLAARAMPSPAELILCDVYANREQLEDARREVLGMLDGCSVRIAESRGGGPDEIYDASLIVGATHVPDVLDVSRLAPGTLLVDDSAPHCFSPQAAIKRFEQSGDIVFTEAGVVLAPEPIDEAGKSSAWLGPLDLTGGHQDAAWKF